MQSGPRRTIPIFATLALLVLPFVPLAVPTAQADELAWTAARLPNLVMLSGAAATDEGIFLVGGHDGFAWRDLDDIVRFDPETGDVTRMDAKLPHPLVVGEAGSDGTSVYVFAGREALPDGNDHPLMQVYRYDPVADALEVLPHAPPRNLEGATPVYLDGAFYFFGGRSCLTPEGYTRRCDTVVRYDIETGAFDTLPHRLPDELTGAEAVAVGPHVYLIGGLESTWHEEVWRFDSATGRTSVMDARLQTGRHGSASFTDGTYVYVMGGYLENSVEESLLPVWMESWTGSRDVLRYDPVADAFTETGAWLWDERVYSHAFWWQGSAFVLGGDCANERDCLSVLEYTLVPGAPKDLRALPDPEGVRLTWAPPRAETTVLPVTAYRVYAIEESEHGGSSYRLLGEVEGEREFVDPTCTLRVLCHYAVSAVNAAGEGGASWSSPQTWTATSRVP